MNTQQLIPLIRPARTLFRPCALASLLALALPSLSSAQDAELIGVLKTQKLVQENDTVLSPTAEPFVFEVYIQAADANAVNKVDLDPPLGPDIPILEEESGDEFYFEDTFPDRTSLDAAYPNGAYVLQIDGANDGKRAVNLDFMGTNSYLPAPRFQDYDSTQELDHTGTITLRWDNITGAVTDDWMFLEIEDENEDLVFESAFPGEPGALNGESTSIELPEGTLNFDSGYTVLLSIIRRVDISDDYPDAEAFAAFQTTTSLMIRTAGPDTDAPTLVRFAPGEGWEHVELNSSVAFEFNEAMDTGVDPAEAIAWTGLPNPDSMTYSWSPSERTLFCTYPGGLPASAEIRWELNPSGSSAKLQDPAGNELPSPGPQGQFLTNSTSNIGTPDACCVEIFKAHGFTQSGDTPVSNRYLAGLFVDFTGISTVRSIDLTIPSVGTLTDVGEFDDNFEGLDAEEEFTEPGDLDESFPGGVYGIMLDTVHDGVRNLTLDPGSGDFPNAPTIANLAALQDWDSTQPLTISWLPMEGGTASDVIFLSIEGEFEEFFSSPEFGDPLVLTGESTSITLPANTLPPGRTLEAELAFLKIGTNDTTQYPDVRLVAGIASLTSFSIQTVGDPFVPEMDIEFADSNAIISLQGERGQSYHLYGSDNLIHWDYLSTLFLDDNPDGFLGSDSFNDGMASESGQKFYQLRNPGGE
jgi:hypothetical protein